MIRLVAGLVLAGTLALAAVPAAAQGYVDPVEAMINELGLSQQQVAQIRQLFEAFARKQQGVPTVGDVLMQNRAAVRQVVTVAPFDRAQAEQLAQKMTAVIVHAQVDRFELRNQVFQVLTPPQRAQYVKMVQETLGETQ